MAHIYDIGTRAWQPDTTEGWVASEVTDKQIEGDKVKLVFQLENGEVCIFRGVRRESAASGYPLTMHNRARLLRRRW